MSYDPDSRLQAQDAQVRAANDPVAFDWTVRAAARGVTAVRTAGRGGRTRWLVKTDCARMQIDQWPDRPAEITVFEPTLGQQSLMRALNAAGLLIVPETGQSSSRQPRSGVAHARAASAR